MIGGSAANPKGKRSRGSVGALVLAIGAIVAVLGIAAGQFVGRRAVALPGLDQRFVPTIQLCGIRPRPGAPTHFDSAVPDPAYVNRLTPGGNGRIDSYRYWPGTGDRAPRWYVGQRPDDSSPNVEFLVYDAAFAPLAQFTALPVPGTQLATNFAVDPDTGDVYVGQLGAAGGGASLARWSIDGAQRWTAPLESGITGAIYTYRDADHHVRVGAVVGGDSSNPTHSNVFSPDGQRVGDNPITGSDVRVAVAHDDELVSTEAGGVAIYDPTASARRFYMDNRLDDQSTWNFHVDGANLLADGTIVATSYNTKSLAFFDPTGTVLGTIGADRGAGQPLDVVNQSSPVEVVDGQLYYNAENPFSAPTRLTSVPVRTARQLYETSAPLDHLGIGAGLLTSQPYNLFPAGAAPDAAIVFSGWWRGIAGQLEGSYTVRSLHDVKTYLTPPPQAFSVPTDDTAFTDGVARVSLASLPVEPDYYEISISLRRNGVVIGSDCLRYTVGSPLLGLDLAGLTPDQSDVRGVQLAHDFGQRLYRSNYNLVQCIAGGAPPDASTHVACPPALVADVTAASALAQSLGVGYEIQLGTENVFDSAAASAGEWSRLVGEMASQLPSVHLWECWNEPNNNTFSSVADYVSRALQPCWTALKAVSHDNLVVGGSFLGVSLPAWKDFVAAGGLQYLDIAADHPYTGHNRSYEEQGHIVPAATGATGAREPGSIQALQAYLAGAGYTGELYNTESGFWNEGPGSFYSQGDKLVRKTILQQSIGIDHSFNFFDDGNYAVDGQTWALLTDVLTPGGLAAATYESVLGNRTFGAWLSTGVPHTYAARYDATAGGDSVVAVWADDFSADLHASLDSGQSFSIIDEYGGGRSLESGTGLRVTGEVQYVTVPAGDQLVLRPIEPFGPNLTTSAVGATASASSTYACDNGVDLDAARAIDAISDAQDTGNNCDDAGMSLWAPADNDPNPALTVTFAQPASIDRVYVAGKGLGSVETGLRSFRVEVAGADGEFHEVARLDNAYFERAQLVSFPSVAATAIRISDVRVNYSGYGNGLRPSFWSDAFHGLGGIYTLEAYGPAPT